MKANKRIRDLSRRSNTGIRRFIHNNAIVANVTTEPWTKDKKGKRIRIREIQEEQR